MMKSQNQSKTTKPLQLVQTGCVIATALMLGNHSAKAANQSFAGDGSALTSTTKWSAAGTTTPFTTSFVTGNVANFGVVNGTGTGGSITVGGLNATENFTITSISGTLSTGGTVANITVASGKTLDLNSEALSTAAGTGFNKMGAGVYGTGAGTFAGGFTLTAGVVVARSTNGLGSGGALNINGGALAANSTKDFTGKFAGGITVGGDFQIGVLSSAVSIAADTANIVFSNAVALGAATRAITIGGNGTYTLGGVISGASGTGLTVNALSGVTGNLTLSGVNAFSGAFTANSGAIVNLTASGNLGGATAVNVASGATVATTNVGLTTLKSTAAVTLNGSLDVSGGTETVASLAGTSTTASLFIGKSATSNGNFTVGDGTSTTYAGTIKDGASGSGTTTFTKQGAGTLTLTGINTYTGATLVNGGGALIINNTSGSGTGTSTVAVSGAGTLLGGTGTITGATTINAGSRITGATSGTVGALTLSTGLTLTGSSGSLATFVVDIDAATADRLTITGNVNLATTFDQIIFNQITAPTATSYPLLSYTGTLSGTFDNVTGLPDGYVLQYNTGEIDLVAVPEPGTILGGVLMVGAACWNQRRRLRGLAGLMRVSRAA